MRALTASVGGKHNARVKKTWRGSWEQFVRSLVTGVPETNDKASVGWVCGAEFDPPYRDSENFVARHFLSFDYDHISPEDHGRLLEHYRGFAFLGYSTWSHSVQRPRLRIWLPLSRAAGYDEFQAVSRRVAQGAGIELAARESHVPAQYMFRPAVKPFEEFEHWENFEGPWVDVDEVLRSYDDWTDRKAWPHRAEGDGVHNEGAAESPLNKPGIVGAFCRAFTVSDAIERFELPYTKAGTEGRWTYTQGSRPEGAIVYDGDLKLHSHHDTDPARGQTNAYDLVRLHKFGGLDSGSAALPLSDRPSSHAMRDLTRSLPEVRKQLVVDEGFEDLDALDTSWLDEAEGSAQLVLRSTNGGADVTLPERIQQATSKLTDQENARRIQRMHGKRLISIGKTFFCWDDTHWAKGDAVAMGLIMDLSNMVRFEYHKLQKRFGDGELTEEEKGLLAQLWEWSIQCGQKTRLSACEALLRTRLEFDAKHLNENPALFSCANGTIDLRTGHLRPHDPTDFITACAPIAYDPAAEAPRFLQFLHEIYGSAPEVDFARRWFGYCITGETREHMMVFHVGRGGNGKSTLMKTFKQILGADYYSTAPQKILMLDEQGATPDLADLLGRRMVTIAETDEKLELREGLIKQITGGDSIKARELYKSPFEFNPTHKLQVFTNFTPIVRSQDFAMWRRIILLNYPVSYGSAEQVASGNASRLRDLGLEDTLAAEAPGILRWLVDGAREWYNDGLKPPPAVIAATESYRAEQDTIGIFAKDRLTLDPEACTPLVGAAGAVFTAYRGWCSSMNQRPLGCVRFSRELMRVVPGAAKATWLEGSVRMQGFKGFSLTDSGLLD